jgi:uncharacterized membrane protein
LINFHVINSILLKYSTTNILFKEDPIPEIHLVNFTDWGWVLLLVVVFLIVWLLIIFQARSKGSHPYGIVSESDIDQDNESH